MISILWHPRKNRSIPFILCALLILMSGCSQKTSQKKVALPSPQFKEFKGLSPDINQKIMHNIPQIAEYYLGIPYRWGGDPDKENGSDCSHLVCAIVRRSLAGTGYTFQPFYLPSPMILKKSDAITKNEVAVGDLVVFRQGRRKKNVDHVGLVTHVKDGVITFTHASSSKGVILTSTNSSPWKYYWKDHLDSYRRWSPEVFQRE
ncbi:C40 family peptidase [Magnetococcales bacterium HHB-1]